MAIPLPTIITTEAYDDDNFHDYSPHSSPNGPSPITSIETALDPPPSDTYGHLTLSVPHPPPELLRIPSVVSQGTSSYPPSISPQTPGPDSDAGSINIFYSPPSPTLTATSIGFEQHDTTKLRDNNPTINSGKSSLQLLQPTGPRQHVRKLSWSSAEGSTADTDPDHHASPITDLPITPIEELPDPFTREFGEAPERPPQLDFGKDHTDPTPFAFNPTHLAHCVDPKNLSQLETWGGTAAVLDGLGSDSIHGLNTKIRKEFPASDYAHPDDDVSAVDIGGEGSTAFSGSDSGRQPPGSRISAEQRFKAFNATLDQRRQIYGANALPPRKTLSLLHLMWMALRDRVLIMLCISAAVSLSLGLYQDFGTTRAKVPCSDGSKNCTAPKVDWVEGVAIIIAIVLVVAVGSINDWQKERQFNALNAKKEDRDIKIIRDGAETLLNIKDVVVGDIGILEAGEIVPVDGIFIRGHNVRCDESSATGESDAVRKASFEECMEEIKAARSAKARGKDHRQPKKDPFIISGSKVTEGIGSYVVIAVGEKSFNGRIMMGLQEGNPYTPLQHKLNVLAELIAKLGSLAGLILFTALMIRFFIELKTEPNQTANARAMSFIQILIISVTVIVVAVPEGLPLAVTLALAFATKRMLRANLLVRILGSCETMANASVICTDKTGTLTENSMTIVVGSVGIHGKYVRDFEKHHERSNVGDEGSCDADADADNFEAKPNPPPEQGEPGAPPTQDVTTTTRRHKDDFAFDMADLSSVLSPQLHIDSSGKVDFIGSKTESALLRFAKELGWPDYKMTRGSAHVVQMIPFTSERKAMGVAIKITHNRWRVFFKGASEVLSRQCTRHVIVRKPGEDSVNTTSKDIDTNPIDELGKENISRTIIFYANQMLRTIALCYRDFEKWPPVEYTDGTDQVPYSYLAQDLTLIGIVGIEDPLRAGVREAVLDCQRAGVAVKMCTGDNVLTARSIATQCGIYTSGGIIMEGPAFRQLSDSALFEIVPRLQVLARSSPEDKKILVAKLKALGEIVGVTGDGTNDSLALKEAHVGFSMGIAGTEVAKEASDIIVMDDNFSSIVNAIMWGRCVNDAVKKFLQFQLTINLSAVFITCISAIASSSEESVLTAVQLLWINIIMDTFAALALATDKAHRSLLNRKPDRQTAPLFSVDMYKMILGQALYSIIVVLVFHFAGNAIFGYRRLSEYEATKKSTELGTFVFNAYVFSQIFNSINCRRIDNKLNVFAGIFDNWYFWVITLIGDIRSFSILINVTFSNSLRLLLSEIGAQILIVLVGGSVFQVTNMNGRDWGISMSLGLLVLPLGVLIRCIPNGPCERLLIWLHVLDDPKKLPVINPMTAGQFHQSWNPAINANPWRSCAKSLQFCGSKPAQQLERAGIQLPSLLAMVPTLVATTIGAGWVPQEGDIADPAQSNPSKSSEQLAIGSGIHFHKDTPRDDKLRRKYSPPTIES
ncbi:hypothetical protein BS47DRAFT_1392337 [Hydnum rufescens UP504]|uniref:Calcium-transporting ATPase 2 n=1 Tax=Hydnum rufescens UP504 TaxID=1448309 RepID=A0A9P6AYY9_9AGAM|nr:hypothetical protein BS47DRAFT_1392337 [Hydnum rufescens UP504]